VPGAAAWLSNVGAADADPLVLGRRRQQLTQEAAVGVLDAGALGQRRARLGYAVGEVVANLLQFAESEHAGRAARRRHRDLEMNPPEGLSKEPGELLLETADLPPQLAAGETLVDFDAGKVGSLQQFPHRSSPRV
jgi:hypothetical protein